MVFWVFQPCPILETADKNFLRDLRLALLAGIRVFEELDTYYANLTAQLEAKV